MDAAAHPALAATTVSLIQCGGLRVRNKYPFLPPRSRAESFPQGLVFTLSSQSSCGTGMGTWMCGERQGLG